MYACSVAGQRRIGREKRRSAFYGAEIYENQYNCVHGFIISWFDDKSKDLDDEYDSKRARCWGSFCI